MIMGIVCIYNFLTCKGSISGLIKIVIMVIFHVLLTLYYIDVVEEENQARDKGLK